MNDSVWVILRAVLMVGGGFLAGKGYVTMDEFTTFIDKAQTALPGVIALGTAGWGIWVRWNTRAVPASTAARRDVPTINAATGAVEPGPSKT